jgi:hypothetical protein
MAVCRKRRPVEDNLMNIEVSRKKLDLAISACLVEMIERGLTAIDVTQEAHDDYVRKVDAEHGQMIWTHPGMTTYHRNRKGRVFSAMPWRFVDYWQMTHDPDFSHYRKTKARVVDSGTGNGSTHSVT